MIVLGATPLEKAQRISAFCAAQPVTKVVVLGPPKFRFPMDPGPPVEWIEWEQIQMYRFFYRLLQEIGPQTLVVVNECLRTKERSDLDYNCMRHYLAQAGHQLVFQHLPIIDSVEDFCILFDFDTKSRWRRTAFADLPLAESVIAVQSVPLDLRAVPVETDPKTKAAYATEKERLFAELGPKDPHTIPRNLYLLGGKAKASHVPPGRPCLGRNTRLKIPALTTYREDAYPAAPYVVIELPHNYLDFTDFLALSGQTRLDVLVADLKVDAWYFERYTRWAGEVQDAYTALRR